MPFFRTPWVEEKFLRKKNWFADSNFSTFFTPKNDLFGQFWDPLDFRAEGPKKNFWQKNPFCENPKSRGLVPPLGS